MVKHFYKYVRVTIRCYFWQRFRISNIFILMYAVLVFSAAPVKFSASLPTGDAFALVVNQHEYIRGYWLNFSKIEKKSLIQKK